MDKLDIERDSVVDLRQSVIGIDGYADLTCVRALLPDKVHVSRSKPFSLTA